MSGGSFDYLCWKDAEQLFTMESQIQQMADRLAGLGYASDAALETQTLLLNVRQSLNRIQAAAKRLQGRNRPSIHPVIAESLQRHIPFPVNGSETLCPKCAADLDRYMCDNGSAKWLAFDCPYCGYRVKRDLTKFANTEPRSDTPASVGETAEASEGPERDGHKPLMRNRCADERSPTGITDAGTLPQTLEHAHLVIMALVHENGILKDRYERLVNADKELFR